MQTKIEGNKALGIWVVSVLVALIVVEIALRFLMPEPAKPARPETWLEMPKQVWTEYHPELGWANKKIVQIQQELAGRRVQLRTGELGLRGIRQYSLEKPNGVYRIYALGDGFPITGTNSDHERWPAQLEAMSSRYEVLDMGVSGYGLDQTYTALLHFGMKHSPDAMVVLIHPNEFAPVTQAFNDAGYGKFFFERFGDQLDYKNVPVPRNKDEMDEQYPDLVRVSPLQGALEKTRVFRGIMQLYQIFMISIGADDPDTSLSWEMGRLVLKKLSSEFRRKLDRLIFVIVPSQSWFDEQNPRYESLKRFCDEERLECLDLKYMWDNAGESFVKQDFYVNDSDQLTMAAHQWIAETVKKRLENPNTDS